MQKLVRLNGIIWYAPRLAAISHSVKGHYEAEEIYAEDITDLVGAQLRECPSALLPDLSSPMMSCALADLRGVNLGGIDLEFTDFTGADLRGAFFNYGQHLRCLRGADLRGCNLRRMNCTGGDLRNADLRFADLEDANFSRANLSGAKLPAKDVDNPTISRDKGLGCILHSY